MRGPLLPVPRPPRASRCYRQHTAHPHDIIRCRVSALFALQTDRLQSARDPDGKDEQKSWILTICEDAVWFCKPIVVAAAQLAGDDDLVGEDAGRGGPGLVWVHKGCEASWTN